MDKLKLAIIGVIHTKARPEFDKDLKFGEKYENEFQKAVEGQVECKMDRRCQETGNVFIEFEDAGRPSGINKTTSPYYAIGLYKKDREKQIWILIPTKILKELMKKYPIKSGGDNWEAKGYIIPKEDLLNYEL